MKLLTDIFIRLVILIAYIFLVSYIDKDIHYNDWYQFPFMIGSILIGIFYIAANCAYFDKNYS